MATDTQGNQEKFSSDYDDQDDQSSNQYDQQSNFDNIKQEDSDDTYNDQQQDSNCGSGIDSPKYIRLRGLPWSATHQEILDFLKDVNVVDGSKGIHLITSRWDGKNTGEAYVEVQCQQDVDEALKLNKASMGHRYIEVFTAYPKEAKEAMRKTGSHGGSYVVKLRGLPYAVTEQQIKAFFKGLAVKPHREGILFVMDKRGRATGEAFVQFQSQEDTEQALGRNREMIGHRYIEIFRSSLAELKRTANGNGRPGPYDLKDRGSNRNNNNDFGGGRNNMRGGGNGVGNWGNNNNGGGGNNNGDGGFRFGFRNKFGSMLNNNPPYNNSVNFGFGFGRPGDGNGGIFEGNNCGGGSNNNGGFNGNNRLNNSNGNFGNDFGDFGNFGNNRNFNNGNNNNSNQNDFGNNRNGGGGGNMGGGGGSFGNFGNFSGNNMGNGMGMGGGNGNNMGGNGFNNGNNSNNMGGNFGPIGGGRSGDYVYFTIHMRGLPYTSYENDVFKFFDPIKPANVRINFNNKGLHSGTADAYFDTYEDAQLAMKRHREQMGSRYIELFFDGKTKGGNSNSGGNNGGGNFSRRI